MPSLGRPPIAERLKRPVGIASFEDINDISIEDGLIDQAPFELRPTLRQAPTLTEGGENEAVALLVTK